MELSTSENPISEDSSLSHMESRPKSTYDYDGNLFRHQMRLRSVRIAPPLPLRTTIAAIIFLIGNSVMALL